MVAVALLGAGALALGVVAGLGRGDGVVDVADDVALPDDAAAGPPARVEGSARGSTMECEPTGCEVWRVDVPLGIRDVVASDELVLQFEREVVIARSVATGRERWRRAVPPGVARSPLSVAVSEHGVALVANGDPEEADRSGDAPVRVTVHDLADGHPRFGFTVDADVDLQVTWVDERLVAFGTDTVPGGLRSHVAVATSEGDVAWRDHVSGSVQLGPDGSSLLHLAADRVGRYDLADGSTAWQVRGQIAAGRFDDALLVRRGREVRVVDLADGTVRTRIPADGPSPVATSLGPWILTTHDGSLVVHDAASGRRLFRRAVPAEQDVEAVLFHLARAVRVGDRVVVSWGARTGGGDAAEVVVYSRDGHRERTLAVPVGGSAPAPVALHPDDEFADVVLVGSVGPPGATVAVDVDDGTVRRRLPGRVVRSEDDLTVLQEQQDLVVLGPAGQVRIRHVNTVADVDSLVVHGVGGMMRVDRGLLVGDG